MITRLLFTVILIVGLLFKSDATVYYVNASATGNGNGLSWANAFTSLQSALSIVIFGDEIWVAAGQYKPAVSSRSSSFVLKNGVNIYGGFAGNETSIEQRNISSNPTTLNGDIGQVGEVSDNSYIIVRASNITSDIILDGFRIINGYNNSPNTDGGGAVRLTSSSSGSLLIKNCYFFSNRSSIYGGAIYLAYSNLIIEDCEFRNNSTTSGSDGGAIHAFNSNGACSLTIKGSKFIGNTSRIGACISSILSFKAFLIDRCIFTNNSSEINILQFGDNSTNIKISNSYFIGNRVNVFNGSLIRVDNLSSGNFELTNCTIAHNFNIYSGGSIFSEMIYCSVGVARCSVRNCIIYGNTKRQDRQITPGMVVSHSLIEGGYPGGTNVINEDPQFVNPNTSASSNFDASSFNYSLYFASPAVNTGNNDFVNPLYNRDLDGKDRIQGIVVDMGCYESGVILNSSNAVERLLKPYYFDYDNNEIVFTFSDDLMNKSFQVYDVSGRLVMNERIVHSRIKTSLIPGVYFVRAENHDPLKFLIR